MEAKYPRTCERGGDTTRYCDPWLANYDSDVKVDFKGAVEDNETVENVGKETNN